MHVDLFICTRYKRRERGKLVKAYSDQDLEGILVCCPIFELNFTVNFYAYAIVPKFEEYGVVWRLALR